MTDLDKARVLRGMIESDDSDDVLLSYLGLARQLILNRMYPYHNTENAKVPARYETLQIELAAYMLNKRGAEGETQHIENGIHRNFGEAYVPSSMLFQIVPMCGTMGWSNEVPEA